MFDPWPTIAEFSVDRWLAIIGICIGIVGIWLAYYFYRRTIRAKLLAVAYTDPVPLVLSLADIEFSYAGASIKSLWRIYILFWNRGTAPIEATDFIAPIEFKSTEPMLKFDLHDKDAAASAHFDPTAKTLRIDLLRPNEAIVLVADVKTEDYRPDIRIAMKSADMSTFTRGLQGEYPIVFGALIAIIILVCEIPLIQHLQDIELLPPEKSLANLSLYEFLILGGVIIMMFGFSLLVGVLTGGFLRRILAATPVTFQFSKIKSAGIRTRQKLSEFRQKLRE